MTALPTHLLPLFDRLADGNVLQLLSHDGFDAAAHLLPLDRIVEHLNVWRFPPMSGAGRGQPSQPDARCQPASAWEIRRRPRSAAQALDSRRFLPGRRSARCSRRAICPGGLAYRRPPALLRRSRRLRRGGSSELQHRQARSLLGWPSDCRDSTGRIGKTITGSPAKISMSAFLRP